MSTTQDTLSANERVVVELDDGTRMIERDESAVEPDDGDAWRYRIETPYDDVRLADERQARLWVAVYALVDGFELPDAIAIPVPVVVAGRPYVVSYLHAVRGWRTRDIAETFDITRKSVWDHWSRVRTQAENQGYLP